MEIKKGKWEKQVIVVKCTKCKRKIFKYQKIGKDRLWHCWEDRITEDYSVRDKNKVKCQCGNLIGVVKGKWIKMKQHSFTYSGTITRKIGGKK